MINQGSDYLRELLRILVRNFGISEKSDDLCCGVTIAQCHALVEIGRAQKISLIGLVELLGLDKSTISRTINNLVDATLVKKKINSENMRYISIQLTDKGAEVFKCIENNMNGYYSTIYKSIPADKRMQVIESLEILIKSIKANK